MRLISLLLPVLSLLSSAVRADGDDGTGSEAPPNTHSVTLHKWPLSLASPIPLGTVGYNPQTKTGDYKVAKAVSDVLGGDDEVVRVGVWDGKEGWFGCVTAGDSLKDPSTAVVTLRLDGAGDVWHVEFSSNSSSSTPKVTILKPTPGPQPHLNKPVVLTSEGKIPEVEVEKTLLQKYWWVLLGGALLMMSTGGGGE
ncbi:hypothetical protein Q9L58_007614 [Maublancomyces gigas]|uniref:ER membrane protein complex subunit 10 n=1 Tax=Discina gigas TaxID=1032678 RepID=A0ABR3GCT0_9PEZI